MTTTASEIPARPSARKLPQTKGVPVFHDLLEVRKKGIYQAVADRWEELGEIFALRLGGIHLVVLTHPEHIHHVAAVNSGNYPKGESVDDLKLLVGNGLFTADGEEWRHNRRLLQPKFRKRAITQYGGLMMQACERMHAEWKTRVGQKLDMSKEMMDLALQIIGSTMFSKHIVGGDEHIGKAYRDALNELSKRGETFVHLPMWVPTKSNRVFMASKRFIDDYIERTVEERRRKEQRFNDLLDSLIEALEDEGEGSITQQQLIDEVSTVFLAGHETTAIAMTWCWYLLAKEKEIREELHAELDTVLGDRMPTVDDLPQLEFTRMVCEETLRLCPPVWVYPRTAQADDVIDGYFIPKGSVMLICPWFAHRRPESWPEPERFDPERFRGSPRRPAHVYCPFGVGARTCAGLSFAMQEFQLVMATLARTFDPALDPGHEPVLVAKGTLRPEGGMPMTLREREVSQ